MQIGDPNKLDLVAKPVSIFLQIVQILVVLGAVIAAMRLLLPHLSKYMDASSSGSAITYSFIGLLVLLAIAATVILNVPSIRRTARGIPAQCKRWIFVACGRTTTIPQQPNNPCLAVTSDFRHVRFSHPSQKTAVDSIYQHLSSDNQLINKYDVIIGESGYGKTKCITLLLESLVRDKSLCKLADNCLYYDFARGQYVQELFGKKLDGASHSDALVVVDNFHLSSSKTIRDVSRVLLDTSRLNTERHLIFLAQPPGSWRLKGYDEIRLLVDARTQGRLHNIDGLNKTDLSHAHLSPKQQQQILLANSSSFRGLASIADIHTAQIEHNAPARDRKFARHILEYLYSNGGTPDSNSKPNAERITDVLSTAVALSILRGVFSGKDFRKAYKFVLSSGFSNNWVESIKAYLILRKLARIGVIPRSSLPGNLYVLHERFAEHIRDEVGVRDDRFEHSFRKAMLWRLDFDDSEPENSVQWVGGVELRDTNRLSKYFDLAMTDGNLSSMSRRLSANLMHIQSPIAQYQLGIILDKYGDFVTARQLLSEVSKIDDRSEIMFASHLALLEAEHGADRLDSLAFLDAAPFPKIQLSAEYWRLHMHGHAGVFSPEKLLSLAKVLTDRYESSEFENSYVLSTLASRVYFDACRHTYLKRDSVSMNISELSSTPLFEILQSCDPCFNANRILYERAHMMSFVALPELAIFSNKSSPKELAGISVEADSISNLCSSIELEYKAAKESFSVFGNREMMYLDADILNAQIQNPKKGTQDVQLLLTSYSEYIDSIGFDDLYSYPYIYKFRLAIRKRNEALILTTSATNIHEIVDEIDAQARIYLSKIEALDTRCSNVYGLWRCRLYSILFNSISNPDTNDDDRDVVKALYVHMQLASKHGFTGDALFISRLTSNARVTVQQVINTLLYHPFVHQ